MTPRRSTERSPLTTRGPTNSAWNTTPTRERKPMTLLPHLAARIFDTPLLIAPQKLEVILAVLAPRLGLEVPAPAAAAASERPARKPYEVTPDGIAVIPLEGTL